MSFPRSSAVFAPRPLALALLLSLASVAAIYLASAPRGPVADEYYYLENAWALQEHGALGRARPGDDTVRAGFGQPLLPLSLVATMNLDSDFAERVRCWLTSQAGEPACPVGFGSFRIVALVAMGLATAFLVLGTLAVSGSALAATLAVLAWLASEVPIRFGNALLTETFTLPFLFAATFFFARGLLAGSRRQLLLAGLLFAGAALARPTFVYLIPVLALLMPLAGRYVAGWAWPRAGLLAVALLAGAVAPLALWSAAKPPAMETQAGDYGAHQLAYRLAYNDVTLEEYAASWLFWLPDFGDVWARAVFGQDAIHRFSNHAEDGFYIGVSRQVSDAAKAATGVDLVGRTAEEGAQSARWWLIENRVVAELPLHAATSLMLAWRGLFVGKYIGLFGVIALVVALARPALATRPGPIALDSRRLLLLMALPPFLALAMQAGVSINIHRYNVGLLQVYCIALGWVLAAGAWRLARRLGVGGRVRG